MENTNTTKLFTLLESGQWEDALPLLKQYLSQDSGSEERGKVHVLVAQAYMKAVTEVNERESALLEQVLKTLEVVEKKDTKFKDDVGLAQAREALK